MRGPAMVETFIGFDSAWAGNRPGAICSIDVGRDGPCSFAAPELASFEQAADFINQAKARAKLTLVAIDQPTIVPNAAGCRPVERVAGSMLGLIGGGAQPANRGKKAAMFGDAAPIWRLLDRLRARQNPPAARVAESGAFVIEVFPALALTAVLPESCKGAAKYNPGKTKTFIPDHWPRVARAVRRAAEELGTVDLANCAEELAVLAKPCKADQDRLDSLICLLVALQWRRLPADRLAVIGDSRHGYMVTPVTSHTRDVLARSAEKRGVPMDAPWVGDACHEIAPLGP